MKLPPRAVKPTVWILGLLGFALLLYGYLPAAIAKTNRPTLVIQWQRLVNDKGQTCDRCGDTGKSVKAARKRLASALKPLGIKVVLKTERMSFAEFSANPSESNRICLNGYPLEQLLQAEVGTSLCCDACADQPCRTLVVDGQTFEAIPPELIVRAGLLLAADLVASKDGKSAPAPCCPASNCCP